MKLLSIPEFDLHKSWVSGWDKIKNLNNLEKVTNILFSNKRKMINKNIKKLLHIDDLNQIDRLNLNLRPSDLKPDYYYKITELYEKK